MPAWMYGKDGKKKSKYRGMKYDYDSGKMESGSEAISKAMKRRRRKDY